MTATTAVALLTSWQPFWRRCIAAMFAMDLTGLEPVWGVSKEPSGEPARPDGLPTGRAATRPAGSLGTPAGFRKSRSKAGVLSPSSWVAPAVLLMSLRGRNGAMLRPEVVDDIERHAGELEPPVGLLARPTSITW
jgi:hypothetical protein